MSVITVAVAEGEAGQRLDRWFRRHYPRLAHGRLEKLLRTGQVRVDGRRAKANFRLEAGQEIRVPPLGDMAKPPPPSPPARIAAGDIEDLRRRVLHRDTDVLVIDKPPGLPVQGGSKVTRHLDAMLDALKFDADERPRLVHRLDKDTSGVLLLGRNARAAAALAAAFRGKEARKIYWALVAGVPRPRQGRIDLALAKRTGPGGGETMEPAQDGKRAVTYYRVIEAAAPRCAWLALMPVTGRTHQLRVHCTAIGTPIVGDGKYGGAEAFLSGAVSRKLHLHAREIEVPHPAGGVLRVRAPLPGHMADSWRLFQFDPDAGEDPFAELDM